MHIMEIVIRWFLLVCIRYWIPSNTNAHSLKWKSNWVFKTNLSCTQDCFLCRSQSSFHSTLIKLLLIKHWSGPICFFYYGRYQLTKLNHRLIEWMGIIIRQLHSCLFIKTKKLFTLVCLKRTWWTKWTFN